jgi:hypothetical protein
LWGSSNQTAMHALMASFWVACGCVRGPEPGPSPTPVDELGPPLTNKKIAFALPDGTHVEGKVMDGARGAAAEREEVESSRSARGRTWRLAPLVARVTEHRRLGRLLGTAGAIVLASGIADARQGGSPNAQEGLPSGLAPGARNRSPGEADRQLRSVQHGPVVIARRPFQQRFDASLQPPVKDLTPVGYHLDRLAKIEFVR